MDLESGKLLEREWLWNTALSLRHMAVSKEGEFAVGVKNYWQ